MTISFAPLRAWIAASCLFALFTAPAFIARADELKGSVSGTVTDGTGAALRGAEISVTGPDVKDINVKTNDQGTYIVNGLASGKYIIKFTYVGFSELSESVDIAAGRVATADAKMELAAKAQTVNVTAGRLSGEAEAVNVERSAVALV